MVLFSDHCWGNPTLAKTLQPELLLLSLKQTIVATFMLTVKAQVGMHPAGNISCCDCKSQRIKLAPIACTVKL